MLKITNTTDLKAVKTMLNNEIKVIPVSKGVTVIETAFNNSSKCDYFVKEIENGFYKVWFNNTDYAENETEFYFYMNSNNIEIVKGYYQGRNRKAEQQLKIFSCLAVMINSILLVTDVFMYY